MKFIIEGIEIDTSEKYECTKCWNGTVKLREITRGQFIAECDNPTCRFNNHIII